MSPQPFSSVTFFIGHSLGGKLIAGRLRDLGAQIEILADHFPTETTDVEWLKAGDDRGVIVLSKDGRIRRDSVERAALKSAGVRAFFPTQQGLTGDEMAEIFANGKRALSPWTWRCESARCWAMAPDYGSGCNRRSIFGNCKVAVSTTKLSRCKSRRNRISANCRFCVKSCRVNS